MMHLVLGRCTLQGQQVVPLDLPPRQRLHPVFDRHWVSRQGGLLQQSRSWRPCWSTACLAGYETMWRRQAVARLKAGLSGMMLRDLQRLAGDWESLGLSRCARAT
jgi:hypothetical protein